MGPLLTGPGITPRVFMSEDGEHLAIVTPKGSKPMGPTDASAMQRRWSPDGSRFAYLGIAPAGRFPVVDGGELAAVADLKAFQFSPDGKRYGFISYGSSRFSVVVDGKDQPTGQGYNGSSFRGSPSPRYSASSFR